MNFIKSWHATVGENGTCECWNVACCLWHKVQEILSILVCLVLHKVQEILVVD